VWLRCGQEEGTSPEEQVNDLLGVIQRMQQAHKEVVDAARQMFATYSRSLTPVRSNGAHKPGFASIDSVGNPSLGGNSLGTPCASAGDGLRWSQEPFPPGCSGLRPEVGSHLRSSSPQLLVRAAVGPPVLRHQVPCGVPSVGSTYTGSSPRWVPSTERSALRQSSDVLLSELAAHPETAVSTTMDPVAGGSPLARSPSANFAGAMCGIMQRVGGVMSAVSPQAPPRDLSPVRSQHVLRATSPAPHSQSMHVGHLQEPRLHVDVDGVRSPLPAPPPCAALPFPSRATDRPQPHSARTGTGPYAGHQVGLRSAEPAPRHSAETWGQPGMRWEQASPCRLRLVGAPRQVMGPPPKAGPCLPRSCQMQVPAPVGVPTGGSKSSATKSTGLRVQQQH
jgi:hypothetical protein